MICVGKAKYTKRQHHSLFEIIWFTFWGSGNWSVDFWSIEQIRLCVNFYRQSFANLFVVSIRLLTSTLQLGSIHKIAGYGATLKNQRKKGGNFFYECSHPGAIPQVALEVMSKKRE